MPYVIHVLRAEFYSQEEIYAEKRSKIQMEYKMTGNFLNEQIKEMKNEHKMNIKDSIEPVCTAYFGGIVTCGSQQIDL